MSTQYLTITKSAIVADDQTAIVSLAPPVGQFWAVSAVRISASVQPQTDFGKSYPYAALYAGAVGIIDPTTFMDDTTLGSGDISSVISGTITAYGDALSVAWQFATPGISVYVTIYGRMYDNLTELTTQLAPVPGARFAGTTGNAAVWFNQSFQQAGPVNFFNTQPFFDTPGNSFCEIVSFRFQLVTTAVAASRRLGVRFIFPGLTTLDVIRSSAIMSQAASLTWFYSFAEGLTAADGGVTQCAPLPNRVICPPSSRITAFGNLIQNGDTWTDFAVTYRQYTSFTNVAFQ